MEAPTRPEQFTNEDLRSRVASLPLATNDQVPSEPQSKRRKVSDESRSLPSIIARLYDVLKVEPKADLSGLDDELQYENPRNYGCIPLTTLETDSQPSMSGTNVA